MRVDMIQPAGPVTYVVLKFSGADSGAEGIDRHPNGSEQGAQVVAAVAGGQKYASGTRVCAGFREGNLLLYDAESQTLVARA